MSLLPPDAINKLLENGKTPDADHVPVVHIELKPEGPMNMAFMLTYIDLDNPEWAYGLCDFGNGKPKMTKISIPVAEECDEPYLLHLEVNEQFDPVYPISVYARAANMMNGITTNQAVLKMAVTHIELTKVKSQYVNPFEGPAFMPMPN